MPVNTLRPDVQEMLSKWRRLRDCFGGRDDVLRAGRLYVPDLKGLDAQANQSYRERGSFYNALARTVLGMNGSIFQEPPEIEDKPDSAEAFLKDVTLTNVSFEMFSSDAGQEVFLVGRYGILVDMPNVVKTDNRPYFASYKAEDIVNWKTERIAGDEQLTMIVLREKVCTPDEDDPFVDKVIYQYRVVQLKEGKCIQQLWREKTPNGGEWAPYEEEISVVRRNVPLDFIPFVFVGAVHATADIDKPPLLDLADVNLGHWRNSVDYEYGLHLTALPTPWVSGSKGSQDGKLKIGPSVVWELELQGSAGMLEFTGSGLGSIATAMEEKKKQMAAIGARLLEDAASTQETASAVRIRHSGELASLKTVAGALEQALTFAYQIALWWTGTEAKPVDVASRVELNKEYTNIKATPQEIQVALTALQAGEISFETWWAQLTAGGWGREGIDAQAELKAIAEAKARAPEPETDPALSPPDCPTCKGEGKVMGKTGTMEMCPMCKGTGDMPPSMMQK